MKKKRIKISTLLLISHSLLFAIFIILSISVFITIHNQKYDAVIINLAGRQRMLTQKTLNEVILYKSNEKQQKIAMQNAMKLFEVTLDSFLYGGIHFIDYKFKEKKKLDKIADKNVRIELYDLEKKWQIFKKFVKVYLKYPDIRNTNKLHTLGEEIFRKSDYIVKLFQRQSERKNAILHYIIFAGIIISIIIFIISIYISKHVSNLSKLKEQFLAIASHDLRAPFNAIIGFSEFLVKDPEIKEDNKYFAKRIKDNAIKQLEYINSILYVAMSDHKQIQLYREKVDIKKLVEECIENIKISGIEKKIIIKNNVEFEDYIVADPNLLTQVINNLLSNAIKFTPENGKIEVYDKKINNKKIEIHVKDNGVGIKQHNKEKLFSKYKKLSQLGTSGEKGSGLGLFISKMIIGAHKGKISVESEPGKGSDFYFTIPVK